MHYLKSGGDLPSRGRSVRLWRIVYASLGAVVAVKEAEDEVTLPEQ